MKEVSNDDIKLRLFPFFLQDRAKDWLDTIPPESITSWDVLAQAFLNNSMRLRNGTRPFEEMPITWLLGLVANPIVL